MTEREAWEAFERAIQLLCCAGDDVHTITSVGSVRLSARDLVKAARAEGHVKNCKCRHAFRTAYISVPNYVQPAVADPRCLAWREGKEPHE